MPTITQGRLQVLAEEYRNALEAGNMAAAERLAFSYAVAQKRIMAETVALLAKLEEARAAGKKVGPAWLYQERRLASLLGTVRKEMGALVPSVSTQVRSAVLAAMAQAETHAQALAVQAAADHLPGVEATFTGLNPDNLVTLTAHLTPGGPLTTLMASLGDDVVAGVSTALVQGVALGKGSDWITRRIRQAADIPRWRAETIARTEAMRAYRETSRLTYASSNVVGSWRWLAFIDRRTCVSCIVMDGTRHPVTEALDGHPRCRCTMEPLTKSWAEMGLDPSLDSLGPPPRSGKDWLAAQSPVVQKGAMGPLKFAEWKAGRITLDDMVARTHSPEWGTMRRERSMAEIRAGRNANHNTPVEPFTPPKAPELPDFTTMTRQELDARASAADLAGAEKDALRQELAKRLVLEKTTDDLERALADPFQKAYHDTIREELERRRLNPAREPAPAPELQAKYEALDADHLMAWKNANRTGARDRAQIDWELKRRHRERVSGKELDPPRKANDMDGVEDAKAVNPRFGEQGFNTNCTNTTTAWEMRRRGFDVIARRKTMDRGQGTVGTDWGADPAEWATMRGFKDAVTYLGKEMPEGARGAIQVLWTKGRGGHIFNWEVRNGQVEFYDAQPGWGPDHARLSAAELAKVVSRQSVQVFRLDNLPLTEALKGYVIPRDPKLVLSW